MQSKAQFGIYSNVLLTKLAIKPPIFWGKSYTFSQLLFKLISASLPSTLS